MSKHDGSGYTGAGYHDVSVDDLRILPMSTKTQDDEWAELKQKWQPSDAVFDSAKLDSVLENWDKYNRVLIKSWDLESQIGIGGSIARLENTKTRARSDDFKFTIQHKGFNKLRPNMDRLREEVDAGLICFKWDVINNVKRYSGTTVMGDFQIIVSDVNGVFQYGWVALGDQLFIPLTNKWQFVENANPSWDIAQSTNTVMNITQAIEYQRTIL
jgi:hypothetical protein